jgi:hypothetical protein
MEVAGQGIRLEVGVELAGSWQRRRGGIRGRNAENADSAENADNVEKRV